MTYKLSIDPNNERSVKKKPNQSCKKKLTLTKKKTSYTVTASRVRHRSTEADVPNPTARTWVTIACRSWDRGSFLLGMMKSSSVIAARELMPELTVLRIRSRDWSSVITGFKCVVFYRMGE